MRFGFLKCGLVLTNVSYDVDVYSTHEYQLGQITGPEIGLPLRPEFLGYHCHGCQLDEIPDLVIGLFVVGASLHLDLPDDVR